jgi:two-component system, OmpR family, phosphate regulon sensor histidine kinase PhoR
MNKIRFNGLIVMMLFSIIGIIWVQIVWIKNAVGIQNQSFDYAVGNSLSNAASAIEAERRMNFLNEFIISNPLSFSSTSNGIENFLNLDTYSSGLDNKFSLRITNQTVTHNRNTDKITTVNKSYLITSDTLLHPDSETVVVTSSPKSSLSDIPGSKYTDGSIGFLPKKNEFQEWYNKRAADLHNMSDQMISEIYQWEKTLELNNTYVGNAIKQSLVYANIITPYKFTVIKNGIIQDSTLKKSEKNDFLKSKYKVQLFPENIIGQELILSIIFPERTNYVLGYIVWILAGSMLFSLFILATFAMSLYFIIRQKKISEMKSDFINNMTHEFKTPIATISLAADTITNPKVINDEKSVRHFIGMIKKENSRMNKKVETILQIASLDKKEIEFRFENVSLHIIIQHAVDTMDIQVQQRNGKINLNLSAADPVVWGDSEHLTNLVSNFLDNALKYSPEEPDINVSTKNIEKGVLLIVEDKGIGMTKAVQSKIFERFYRQSSGNVHDVKGFGLGLNYARAIIDAHKGIITVFSEPGKGSRFEIFLPFNCEN